MVFGKFDQGCDGRRLYTQLAADLEPSRRRLTDPVPSTEPVIGTDQQGAGSSTGERVVVKPAASPSVSTPSVVTHILLALSISFTTPHPAPEPAARLRRAVIIARLESLVGMEPTCGRAIHTVTARRSPWGQAQAARTEASAPTVGRPDRSSHARPAPDRAYPAQGGHGTLWFGGERPLL